MITVLGGDDMTVLGGVIMTLLGASLSEYSGGGSAGSSVYDSPELDWAKYEAEPRSDGTLV